VFGYEFTPNMNFFLQRVICCPVVEKRRKDY